MTKLSQRPNAEGMQPEIWTVTQDYLEYLDCPRALTVFMLCKYGEWLQVAKLKATPKDYCYAGTYHSAALATDFLRKWPDLPVKVDRVQAAKLSWYQSEAECRVSNIFLQTVRLNSDSLNLLLDVAADFVKEVLGPCPLDLSPRFGPGATASDPATHTTVLDKVSSRVTITSGARCLIPLWEGTAWARALTSKDGYYKSAARFKEVEGNSFFTVPKTALIDRGCAKGPSFNLGYQLPVGRHLRQRLKAVLGLDLERGQQHHQELARIGSLTGVYATLDSERASDTQSYQLIKRLTCKVPLWFELFDSLREPSTKIDGAWVRLEKFSAMGNGFTFELETVVFLALAYATAWAKTLGGELVGPHGLTNALDLVKIGDISVYGDDVIVPTEIGRDVAAVYELCGFTVNLQKSYFEGEFRESCGGEFFRGQCVSTVKLSKEITEPADYFSLHNLLYGRVTSLYGTGAHLLISVKDNLPRKLRNMYGPTFLGDLVLHGWYGPQVAVRTRKHPELNGADSCQNQWTGVLRTLAPRLHRATMSEYASGAQLAYLLYTNRSEPPTRRPTAKVSYQITHYEGDYHIIFDDKVPKPPRWIINSPFRKFFGISEDGTYVA